MSFSRRILSSSPSTSISDAAVLAVDHFVADLHRELAAVAAIEQLARAGRDHFAALRLFLGGVRQNDAARGDFFGFERIDHDAIVQRSQIHTLAMCRFLD